MSSSSEDQRPWWSGGVRMHHPNMRDLDVRGMDFDRFVEEAMSLHANAIVITSGGFVAYYPTAIEGHRTSELLEGRDFVGEVTRRAHAVGIRVIARLDLGGVWASTYQEHPDWIARDAEGRPVVWRNTPGLYATCPNSPHRGEGYAIPIMRELLTRYGVDGFHAPGGWPGYCHCSYCRESFRSATGEALPMSRNAGAVLWARYVEWHYECEAKASAAAYRALRELKPDVFLQNELALRGSSYDLPSMGPACSALVITTGNVTAKAPMVRSWAGLGARYARTANRAVQPLLNLKVFVRSGGWPRAMVPPNEYRLWLWQAIANSASLKTPVFGTFAQEDQRNLPAIRDAFALMRDHPGVYAEARPVAPVALVWPRRTFDYWRGPRIESTENGVAYPDTTAAPFDGMYTALVEEHIPFDVLSDGYLTPEHLAEGDYRVLVLAGAACLSEQAAETLADFVRQGGGVLLTGWTGWADEIGRHRSAPALGHLAGIRPLDLPPLTSPGLYLAPIRDEAAYQAPSRGATGVLAGLENVGLVSADGPVPAVVPSDGAAALRLVRHRSVLPIEAIDDPMDTGCAGVVLSQSGDGRVATITPPLDALYWRWHLADHRQLIANLLRWCAAGVEAGASWPLETEAPSTVEVTLARNGGQYVVHFVNATGLVPLAEVIPVDVGTTRVELDAGARCHSARRLIAGDTIPVMQEENAARFDLRKLGPYEVVVLETL